MFFRAEHASLLHRRAYYAQGANVIKLFDQ
jgi:hypothetical protein